MAQQSDIVFLLRHGETEWNAAGRLQGHLDSPLTPKGRAQADAQGALLAPLLRRYPEAHILTSPLGRAAQTAQIALASVGQEARPEPDAKEISAGSWDGKTLEWIERTHGPLFEQSRNAFELMFLAPDGEGLDTVFARAKRLLSRISGPTVIFTHGAFLCVLRGILRGLDHDQMLNLSHEQGCIYQLRGGCETVLK